MVADDSPQGCFFEDDFVRTQAIGPDLAWDQVTLGYFDLLVFGVAVQGQNLHPVAQRWRDGFQQIACTDEHHLREVKVHVQVVVAEGAVLLGVQNLQQSRRRVAPPVGADFVHLVQHKDRVSGPHPFDGLDNAAGQGSDVGAAMAADLSLVAHASQRHAGEFPSQSAGHGPSQRRLARPRWPDKAEDGGLSVAVHR